MINLRHFPVHIIAADDTCATVDFPSGRIRAVDLRSLTGDPRELDHELIRARRITKSLEHAKRHEKPDPTPAPQAQISPR